MSFHRHLIAPMIAATGALLLPGPAPAQQRPQPAPPPVMVPATAPTPAAADIYRMIWGTMAAVDGAMTSGNYSVLRDTAAPDFQAVNDTARLAGIFARLRAGGVDLSQTLLLTPTFRATPRLVQPGLLQVQGSFGLRPAAIDFEMLYQWTGGKWRMFGVAISTSRLPSEQALPAPLPQKR